MKRLPFRRRLALWSTLLAAVVVIISGACAAYFVYRRALAQLEGELSSESAHFFAELGNHGGAKFDWHRIRRRAPRMDADRRPAAAHGDSLSEREIGFFGRRDCTHLDLNRSRRVSATCRWADGRCD
jgi:hypothetical protein